MKIIELKSIIRKKYLSIPVAILMFYVAYMHLSEISVFDKASFYYIIIGFLLLLSSFEREIFGVLRYVKITDKKFIYKKLIIAPKQEVNLSDITEVKFHGSNIYVKSDKIIMTINLDLLKMSTRFELRDYFEENFKDILIFAEQDNIFVKRYQQRLKRIEEKLKLKNEQ